MTQMHETNQVWPQNQPYRCFFWIRAKRNSSTHSSIKVAKFERKGTKSNQQLTYFEGRSSKPKTLKIQIVEFLKRLGDTAIPWKRESSLLGSMHRGKSYTTGEYCSFHTLLALCWRVAGFEKWRQYWSLS